MLHYSRITKSENILNIIWKEFKKFPAFFSFKAKQKVEEKVKMMKYIAGEDVYSSQSTKIWEEQRKEIYSKILEYQQKQENEKRKNKLENLTFLERMIFQLKESAAGLRQSTSMKAGKMALLQHCAAAHAAEIAVAQNIDLKNIRMVLEKQKKSEGASVESNEEEVVVGYIEAPNASEEEVHAFAAAVQRACPVSRHMSIEWRKELSSSSSAFRSDPIAKTTDNTSTAVKKEDDSHAKRMTEEDHPNPLPRKEEKEEVVPLPPSGMPGTPLRSRETPSESSSIDSETPLSVEKAEPHSLFRKYDDDDFSLPGLSTPRKKL